MEEKKRRPRLKPGSDSPLKERSESQETPENTERYSNPAPEKPWQNRDQQGGGGYQKPWQNRDQQGGGGYQKPWQNRDQQGGGGYQKPWQNRDQQGGGGHQKPWQNRDQQGGGGHQKPWQNRDQQGGGGYQKPWQNRDQQGGGHQKPWQNRDQQDGGSHKPWQKGGFNKRPGNRRPFKKQDDFFIERKPKPALPTGEGMPLNKYLAHCGIASRRKAVDFIKAGQVLVNGEAKLEPFYRVEAQDVITCEGQTMSIQERQIYVLLNKPKNVITTTEDEHGRATVLDIIDPEFPERLFPVGRLDRDTTGLILLTNDGDLAQKLTHPSYAVHKHYRAGLRTPIKPADFEKIQQGVELEDGPMEVNWIRYSEDHPDGTILELEITSGRNRIVRRLFEHLGYEVYKLDRFYFAGLTKKELPRGKFRELTQREVIMLKHFTGHPSTGKKRKKEEDADEQQQPDTPDEN